MRDGSYEIIRRTKDAVSKTCRCDVTAPFILKESQNDARFDVVVSSTCLEAACLDVPTYENAVWKIAQQMLKPGAFFVQCGLTGTNGYTIGKLLTNIHSVSFEAIFAKNRAIRSGFLSFSLTGPLLNS